MMEALLEIDILPQEDLWRKITEKQVGCSLWTFAIKRHLKFYCGTSIILRYYALVGNLRSRPIFTIIGNGNNNLTVMTTASII